MALCSPGPVCHPRFRCRARTGPALLLYPHLGCAGHPFPDVHQGLVYWDAGHRQFHGYRPGCQCGKHCRQRYPGPLDRLCRHCLGYGHRPVHRPGLRRGPDRPPNATREGRHPAGGIGCGFGGVSYDERKPVRPVALHGGHLCGIHHDIGPVRRPGPGRRRHSHETPAAVLVLYRWLCLCGRSPGGEVYRPSGHSGREDDRPPRLCLEHGGWNVFRAGLPVRKRSRFPGVDI